MTTFRFFDLNILYGGVSFAVVLCGSNRAAAWNKNPTRFGHELSAAEKSDWIEREPVCAWLMQDIVRPITLMTWFQGKKTEGRRVEDRRRMQTDGQK